ncbi:triose-phosphate isomerase [Aedoeadaptatus coxii]|uniref:triose-phosphate isomerase n=1 Tax=Aedoeadaptatus coxii TaxID=755172 RepID=UPI002AD54476|nr:triose-phosphate isomerase [Peptoniphilus coxii]
MRQKVVAGNWKMNTTLKEGEALIKALVPVEAKGAEVIIAPPFTHLDRVASCIEKTDFALAAQNLSEDTFGAHTGEIAGEMLKDIGCRYVIIGHSECRGRGESDAVIQKKIARAIETGLTPIICFGEDEDVYGSGKRMDFLKKQVHSALESVKDDHFLLAYEPIWAIGTGKTASAEDANEVISDIRKELPESYREAVRILYGGSVKADNVAGFLKAGEIDGVLVGGASLKADSFKDIIDEVSHV